MRISDWSSDVCSSDLHAIHEQAEQVCGLFRIVNRRVCRFCLVPELARLQRARQHRLAQRGAGQRCRIEHAERVERAALGMGARDRTEERRVGKGSVITFSSRWTRYHKKQKQSKKTQRCRKTNKTPQHKD